MRRLRIGILIFFLAVAAFFAASFLYERVTSDTQGPVIKAENDSITVSVSATDEDLMQGLTANDNLDGDVTDTLVVVSKSKFVEKGVLHVTYAAFDQNNNVGTYSREVTFNDYISPRFHLYAPLRYVGESTGSDYLENITAEDCIDGNITSQIKISLGRTIPLSDNVVEQKVNLQVTNSCGDSTVLELTVTTEDFATYNKQAPSLKEYVVYLRRGESIDLNSYPNGIWAGGKVKSFDDAGFDPNTNISLFNGGLNVDVPGIYRVTYSLVLDTGETLGTAALIVVVEE